METLASGATGDFSHYGFNQYSLNFSFLKAVSPSGRQSSTIFASLQTPAAATGLWTFLFSLSEAILEENETVFTFFFFSGKYKTLWLYLYAGIALTYFSHREIFF